VAVHLCDSVWYCICYIDFIAGVHESIIEAHSPVRSLPLRVQIIDLFLVGADLVGHISAAILDPAALAFL